MKAARARIRDLEEMLVAANRLDANVSVDTLRRQRDPQGGFILAMALDLAAEGVDQARAVDEILDLSAGSPMALLGARALAQALCQELPEDERAACVVDLLTEALHRAHERHSRGSRRYAAH